MESNFNDKEEFLAKWLSGEISPEERTEFENSSQGQEFAEILSSIDKLSFPAYDVEAELRKQKASQKVNTKVRSLTPIWRMAVAAVLVLSISLVYFLSRPNYEVFKTAYGERQTITLPDNSVVTLNVNSTLKYDPDDFDTNRKLLLEGEAFFQVTKGAYFEVDTDKGTVKVLGTSFNVIQRNDNLAVQVYTGVVRVNSRKVERTLEKGDGLRLEGNKTVKFWKIEVQEQPDWVTNNIMELRDVPLQEAIESLTNSFGINIDSDISLTSERYTGSYPLDNVEVAIQIVLSTSKIEYEYDSDAKKLNIIGFTEN